MTMECKLVTQFFPAAITFRGDVIDFNGVSILEEQFTPSALPLLLLLEFGLGATEKRVFSQPCTPVQQISVIGAGSSLHFSVSLDFGAIMGPQFGSSIREVPWSFPDVPVVPGNPSFSFVGVSSACPSKELVEQEIATPTEGFSGDNGAMIIRPSAYLGVEHLNELTL